jgi:hypothetical protein
VCSVQSGLQKVEDERVDRVSDAFALERLADQPALRLKGALAGDVSRRGKRFSFGGQVDELCVGRFLRIEQGV